VILAGFSGRTIDSRMQPVTGSGAGEHNKVWGSSAFLTHAHSTYTNERYYPLCEELLSDGRLAIWEEANKALEERRLRLESG
jgi:hypothetical protein